MLANPKGMHVELRAPAEGAIHADPLRLRQVLDNLISNAVKFSPKGSTVTVVAERSGTDWKISVRDEGPGLKEADRASLFQEFSKLSARPTGGEKSTGLGLAIVKQVVLAQGGTIDVDSTPGKGATFWFTLPASHI
jgi:signal transduction histidine kinase